MVDGLVPANEYLLVLNGGVVGSYGANTRGRLDIKSPPGLPIQILDLGSVMLWDSASNTVVGTTLP